MGVAEILRRQSVALCQLVEIWHLRAANYLGIAVVLLHHYEYVRVHWVYVNRNRCCNAAVLPGCGRCVGCGGGGCNHYRPGWPKISDPGNRNRSSVLGRPGEGDALAAGDARRCR